MKFTKLFVSTLTGCLLVVGISARTAQAEPDPAQVMPRFVAQSLKAGGLEVQRDGDVLTVQNLVELEVPRTLQDWEDIGIRAKLVPTSERLVIPLQTDTDEDPLLFQFAQFRNCLTASDFVYQVEYVRCELHPTDLGDLTCKTRNLLDHVFNGLQCMFTFLCTAENNFCA